MRNLFTKPCQDVDKQHIKGVLQNPKTVEKIAFHDRMMAILYDDKTFQVFVACHEGLYQTYIEQVVGTLFPRDMAGFGFISEEDARAEENIQAQKAQQDERLSRYLKYMELKREFESQ